MTFFIKILNEVHGRQRMKIDGYSGARFIFIWDRKLRAYTYQPETQDEVDDLFRTMGRATSYFFAPVSIAVDHDVPPVPFTLPDTAEPVIPPASKLPLDSNLVESALLRGVIVTEEDTDEIAIRLNQAYDKGAQDALNNLTATKKPRPRKPAKELVPA